MDTVKKALTALDFTSENEDIASRRSEIARLQEAIQRAEARCAVIARMLIEQEAPNGTDVADALLQDANPQAAASLAPDHDALRKEKEALRAGIRELRERERDHEAAITDIGIQARGRAANASRPLVEALQAEMQAAAEKLLSGYAAINALSYAFRSFSAETGAARKAVDGVMGQGRLLPYNRTLPVPVEVCEVLETIRSKGEALPVQIVRQVQMS